MPKLYHLLEMNGDTVTNRLAHGVPAADIKSALSRLGIAYSTLSGLHVGERHPVSGGNLMVVGASQAQPRRFPVKDFLRHGIIPLFGSDVLTPTEDPATRFSRILRNDSDKPMLLVEKQGRGWSIDKVTHSLVGLPEAAEACLGLDFMRRAEIYRVIAHNSHQLLALPLAQYRFPRPRIILVTGDPGSGKSTLIDLLIRQLGWYFQRLPSVTTRAKRDEDRPHEYVHVDGRQFSAMAEADEFFQTIETEQGSYGTLQADLEAARADPWHCRVGAITPDRLRIFKEYLGSQVLCVTLPSPPDRSSELLKRMVRRGDSHAVAEAKLAAAKDWPQQIEKLVDRRLVVRLTGEHPQELVQQLINKHLCDLI